jgi:hypothetical protein
MTSETTMLDGDVPLSAAQVEKLVQLVLDRLEHQQRAQRQGREATAIRNESTPGSRSL